MKTSAAEFDQSNPDIYEAWVLIAHEHRLDPWRSMLSAGEVIEALRRKGFALSNDYKPFYARKFNAEYNDDGLKFNCHRLKKPV